jgi:dihydroorotase-like cyclic amidohydrolase
VFDLPAVAERARARFAAGAVAVSDDGRPVVSAQLMRSALEYARTFGIPVADHCEEPGILPRQHPLHREAAVEDRGRRSRVERQQGHEPGGGHQRIQAANPQI